MKRHMNVITDYSKKLHDMKLYMDASFLERVYAMSEDVYIQRIKAIDFVGKERVLDAGAGYGQWSMALAGMNSSVESCDISEHRVEFIKQYAKSKELSNISVRCAALPELPYDDCCFDAVFCYSVISFIPWKESLQELYRVLKPGGHLYVNSNALGYVLYSWENPRNATSDYDPRTECWKALRNTVFYEKEGISPDGMLVIERDAMQNTIDAIGFEICEIAGEGKINVSDKSLNPKSFYPEKYKGFDCVYDVLAQRPYQG